MNGIHLVALRFPNRKHTSTITTPGTLAGLAWMLIWCVGSGGMRSVRSTWRTACLGWPPRYLGRRLSLASCAPISSLWSEMYQLTMSPVKTTSDMDISPD